MKAYRLKITCFILLLLPVLTCCTDEELLRGSGVPEGVPTTVDISVGTAANRAKTRSGLPEGEERKIYNLYLWVFDSRGGVEFSREYPRAELYQAAAALETATGEKDTDAPTSMGLLKNIPITSGEKTLVLLANYKSDGDGLFQVEPGILAGVSSLSDIQRVKAEMTARTLFRPNGNLLMSVTKTEEISPDTRRLEVSLKRAEAKITVNLKTGEGLTFVPGTWRVGNVPASTFVTEHVKGSDAGAPWDAGGMEMDSYWLSELFQFEGDATTTTTTTFYLPENRKLAKKMITPASPGYNAERKGYDLRQKQVKSPVPDATEKPNVQNGATEYAPDLAPYIEFTGELRQDMTTGEVSTERFGRVTYRVYLGYTAENDPVNDYDIERNVHYTYNVTIKGMNDLVVEAMSDKDREEEPAPGVEGLVYDAHRSFSFDCHYEQGLMRFNKDELAIFSPDGSLKDDAMISFAIRTPFCDKIVSYTRAELEQLEDNGYVPSGEKKADTGWLAFFIHPSTLSDNGNETMEYYSNTGAHLLSLEQFLYRLVKEPDYVFNASTGLCKVTVYANEYFYERNPMQDGAPEDKNLWKTFANAPDRTFDLLVNTSHEISPDGQSRYHQAVVSIRQMSIKTVFTEGPEGMRVWGVENVNETPDLDFMVKAPGEPDAFYNKYTSNGWSNTWKVMARSGDFSQEVMIDPMRRSKQDQLWQVMTKVDNAKLTLSRDHYNLAAKNYHAEYACFTPFLRNRDDNRDGRMQAAEMKWYIPSVSESGMLIVGERALPLHSRLHGHAPSDNATAFYMSRAFMASTNLSLYSSNPYICILESRSVTPIANFDYYKGGNSPGDRTPYSEVRLIRDLGMLESGEESYHIEELGKELNKSLVNNRTKEEYLVFRADNLPYSMTRGVRAIYELPAHDEDSQSNTIYKNGFEVAKYIANKIDKPKDLNNPDRKSEYYLQDWSTLMADIEQGNSPCAYYYQEADKSDLGTWRVPNEVELIIMCGSLFDWHNPEKKEVYEFGNDLPSLGVVESEVLHSRTGFSKRSMNGARSFSAGYQMYLHGYLRWVTTVDTQWAGDNDRLVNNRKGYVRCVRDLP